MFPYAPSFEIAQPRSLPNSSMCRGLILAKSNGAFGGWQEVEANFDALFDRESYVKVGERYFIRQDKVSFIDEPVELRMVE